MCIKSDQIVETAPRLHNGNKGNSHFQKNFIHQNSFKEPIHFSSHLQKGKIQKREKREKNLLCYGYDDVMMSQMIIMVMKKEKKFGLHAIARRCLYLYLCLCFYVFVMTHKMKMMMKKE